MKDQIKQILIDVRNGALITPKIEEIMEVVGKETIIDKIANLTDEERLAIFSSYCKGCGRKELECECYQE